jgi:dienelactone hydrolase
VQPNRELPRDAYGALAYLRTRPDVKQSSIAILGQSFGAIAMFYTIAEGARPKELSPEQDFRAAIAFYPYCPPFLACKWKPRQPLLFLMGEADNFVPAAPCKELVTAAAASGGPSIEAHWYIQAPTTPLICQDYSDRFGVSRLPTGLRKSGT